MATIRTLQVDNRYARLPAPFFERVRPTPLPDPQLCAYSPEAADLLELTDRPDTLVPFLCGNRLFPGADPIAAVYAGHQFGVWVPRLGDGRAILLAEVLTSSGRRWDFQLKGAGQTQYSRFGDGRSVLRSTIREFLCSEAMAGLGIPTTRALSIVTSTEPVQRESVETAATLVRLSPTHVRFGTFQFFASRRQQDHLRILADHVIDQHHPQWSGAEDRYQLLLRQAGTETAQLIADWMAVGFAHGVMNTDNMSILGLTIDYGPFGFLDTYDPRFICNHSDDSGRYAFGNQPGIGLWNVTRLAEALLGLVPEDQAVEAVEAYRPVFEARFLANMRRKLGLQTGEEGDGGLIAEFLGLLQTYAVDYTCCFRALALVEQERPLAATSLRRFFQNGEAFDRWLEIYGERLRRDRGTDHDRRERMNRVNPVYVLRNWLAERAIRRAIDDGDYTEIEWLRALLADPWTPRAGCELYADPPPDWGRRLVVSCSS